MRGWVKHQEKTRQKEKEARADDQKSTQHILSVEPIQRQNLFIHVLMRIAPKAPSCGDMSL